MNLIINYSSSCMHFGTKLVAKENSTPSNCNQAKYGSKNLISENDKLACNLIPIN